MKNLIFESGVFSEDTDAENSIAAASKYFNVVEIKDARNLFDKPNLKTKEIHFWRGSFALKSKLFQFYKIQDDNKFYDAPYWLPSLKHFALNGGYFFLDAESILRAGYSFFPVFIRPTAGNKIFSGRVFKTREDFQTEFNFFTKNLNHSPHIICQISPTAVVNKEFRFVVVGGKVIDGSLYMENEEVKNGPVSPHHFAYVENLIKQDYFLNKDNFVVDICENGDAIKLLEINSIHTASFYGCDLDKVYKAISDNLN